MAKKVPAGANGLTEVKQGDDEDRVDMWLRNPSQRRSLARTELRRPGSYQVASAAATPFK